MWEKIKNEPLIIIEGCEFELKSFRVSELGYLMMRLYSIQENKFVTFNLGKYDPNNNVFLNLIENGK